MLLQRLSAAGRSMGPARASGRRCFSSTVDQNELAASLTKEVSIRQSLEALVKDVDKFRGLERDQIEHLWKEFHVDKPFALVGKTIEPTDWTKLKERATMAPFFVIPNMRDGNYFTLVTEYKEEFVMMTFLEDYKRLGANAVPWCSIRFFTELDPITLVQTKFSPYLTKEEAGRLSDRWIEFYTDNDLFEKHTWPFNKMPESFSFEKTFPEVIQKK